MTNKENYMLMADLVSKSSNDPNTKVGAVIVSEDNCILSTGYNDFPRRCQDNFPWDRTAPSEYDTKYPYVCHAELSALSNYYGDRKYLNGASIYVTLFPCHECAKLLIQFGISKVYYLSNKYKDTMDYKESKRLFDSADVKCVQCIPNSLKREMKPVEESYTSTLMRYNKNGCEMPGIRFCSACDGPIESKKISKIQYCYHCGSKIKP